MNNPDQMPLLSADERQLLLEIARQSLSTGLKKGHPLSIVPTDYPKNLQAIRATFVTLEIAGRLRGCIGTLAARDPLVTDVAQHAFAAAFEDPRFPPLQVDELPQVAIHISILSPPESLSCTSEDDLLNQLRVGIDGLILSLGARRATFLPSVWESLPHPYLFLAQLKQKAGLPLDFWSEDMQFERYTTESFSDDTEEPSEGARTSL